MSIKPTAEASHLLSAFRQLDHAGRRGLVRRIMGASNARGGTEPARLCERMLEADEFPLDVFAHAVVGYAALDPDLQHGRKFTTGRKTGTVGKVRAWVQKYMKKNPDAKPAQAWAAFGMRPPKGCEVEGDQIWTKGADRPTGRAWFGTMVGQERPKRP